MHAGEGVHDVGNGATLFDQCLKTFRTVDRGEKPIIIWFFTLAIYSLVMLKSRNNVLISGIMCLFVCIGIGMTPKVNNYMGLHYARFGFKANYFDQPCVFLFMYWCVPLLIVACTLIIVIFVDLLKKNWSKTIKGILLQWKERRTAV